MTDIKNLTAILGKIQDCGAKEHPAGQGDRIELLQNREVAAALIENGVTVQRWIPVTEPPKKSGEYLTICHHYRNGYWQEVVPFDADKGYFVDLGKSYYPYVTRWMPLPEAPKEVE